MYKINDVFVQQYVFAKPCNIICRI